MLNLIVKDGLNLIGVEIHKIHENVLFWLATPSRVESFHALSNALIENTVEIYTLDTINCYQL